MKRLVATPTLTLDAKLFRRPALTSEELEKCRRTMSAQHGIPQVQLHPMIFDIGELFEIDLATTWSELRPKRGSQSVLLSELGECSACATFPAVSELNVTVWTEYCTEVFIDIVREVDGMDPKYTWDYGEVGCADLYINNEDGRPITVGQLLAEFCDSNHELAERLGEYANVGLRLRTAVFHGWREHSFEDGVLSLEEPRWTF